MFDGVLPLLCCPFAQEAELTGLSAVCKAATVAEDILDKRSIVPVLPHFVSGDSSDIVGAATGANRTRANALWTPGELESLASQSYEFMFRCFPRALNSASYANATLAVKLVTRYREDSAADVGQRIEKQIVIMLTKNVML